MGRLWNGMGAALLGVGLIFSAGACGSGGGSPGPGGAGTMLATWDGTFMPYQILDVPDQGTPTDVSVVDVNHDGLLDIVFASATQANGLGVALGNPNGVFDMPLFYELYKTLGLDGIDNLNLVDMNHDGHLDVVIESAFTSEVVVLLGNGHGVFAATYRLPIPGGIRGLAVADFNRDGDMDVGVATGDDYFHTILGNGTGALGATLPTVLLPAGGSVGLTVGDVQPDGAMDAALVNVPTGKISIIIGYGDGRLLHGPLLPSVGGSPTGLGLHDLDGDGILDMVVLRSIQPTNVVILKGSGNGWTEFPSSPHGALLQPSRIRFTDLNVDGKPDLLTAGTDGATYLLGLGGGDFAPAVTLPVVTSIRDVAVGDVNRDGVLDLVITRNADHQVQVLLGGVQ
jgi:FG-GAP-like repeat